MGRREQRSGACFVSRTARDGWVPSLALVPPQAAADKRVGQEAGAPSLRVTRSNRPSAGDDREGWGLGLRASRAQPTTHSRKGRVARRAARRFEPVGSYTEYHSLALNAKPLTKGYAG